MLDQTKQVVAVMLPWLPTMVTLLGWYVVNRQNNKREQRKEARAAADRCKVLLRDASKSAIQYWGGEGDIKAWQVKALFEELEVELGCLPSGKVDGLLAIHVSLLNVALGGDFGADTFKPLPSDQPVFKEITRLRQQLLQAIEQALRSTQ